MTAIEELRHSPDQLRTRIAAELERARDRSRRLTDIDHDELVRQHSPLMSPLVWDYAHIGSQEELWLVRDVGGREPVRPDIDDIYDAFRTKRADRPSLPLLSPAEARRYVREVRDKALDVLDRTPLTGRRLVEAGFAFGMIVQHEQQHVETMFATHQLRVGAPVLDAPAPPSGSAPDRPEVHVPGGMFLMGTDLEPWALDNERPAHAVGVEPYWIDTDPVTNAQYAAFIDAGGYDNPDWWTADGWAYKNTAGLVAPQFWDEGARTRFGHVEPIPPDEPVQHVCWYEADAYARWAGKRLPTEAEWEMAARFDPETGRSRRFPWGDDDPRPEHANLGGTYLQPARSAPTRRARRRSASAA